MCIISHKWHAIAKYYHHKFFEQLLKSGEVEVVERGEVVIGLTGDFRNPYYDDKYRQWWWW